MIKVSPARIAGCFVGIVLLFGGLALPGLMKFGATMEGAPEKLWRSNDPKFAESYQWSAWSDGSGELRVPPLDELKGATINAHRIGNRRTLFKNYTFCQARYHLKDGTVRSGNATCPRSHVTVRENRAWLAAAFFRLDGSWLAPALHFAAQALGQINPSRYCRREELMPCASLRPCELISTFLGVMASWRLDG